MDSTGHARRVGYNALHKKDQVSRNCFGLFDCMMPCDSDDVNAQWRVIEAHATFGRLRGMAEWLSSPVRIAVTKVNLFPFRR